MTDTTTNSHTTSTTHPEDVGVSMNSTSTTHTTTSIETQRKRKFRGATMYIYTKVKKSHKNGIRFLIRVDVATDNAYGEHVEDFMYYVALQGRSKVSILLDNWHDDDDDLKTSLWTNITVFILNFMICFTSMYDHLIFCLILITNLLCKSMKCLLLV